jgi:hypothetical protein
MESFLLGYGTGALLGHTVCILYLVWRSFD